MKINVEFGSVEEMQEFAKLVGGSCSDKTVTVTPTVEKEVEKDNSKSDKKNTSKKSEKAKSEDKPKTVDMREEAKKKEAEDKAKNEAQKVEVEQVGEPEPTVEEPPKDVEPTEKLPKVTKEELRAACTRAVKSGKAAEVKKIFEKYGAEKLPEVKEENFADVLKDVEAL